MSLRPESRPAIAVTELPWVLGRIGAYFELTKPRLASLVLAATAAGFLLGCPRPINLALMLHTLLGTALVAGGACALNQVMEAALDARMRRTAGRPLPSGRLTHDESLYFGVGISIVGVSYLLVATTPLAAALAAMTTLLYLAVYTPLKRVTELCLAAGAIPGAMPPLIGFAAATGTLTYAAWLAALIVFFWQHPHFLAISWMYRDDYAHGGFRMLAVVDPDGRAVARQIVSRTLALLLVSLLPAAVGAAGPRYAVAAMALGLAFFAFVLHMASKRDERSARRLFVASIVYLPLLLGLLVIDTP